MIIDDLIIGTVNTIMAGLEDSGYEKTNVYANKNDNASYRLTNSELGLRLVLAYHISAQLYCSSTISWEVSARTQRGGYAIRANGRTHLSHRRAGIKVDTGDMHSAQQLIVKIAETLQNPGVQLNAVRRAVSILARPIYLTPFSFSPTLTFRLTKWNAIARSVLFNTAKVMAMGTLTNNNRRKRTAFMPGGADIPESDVWFLMDCTVAHQHVFVVTNGDSWYPAHCSMAGSNRQVAIPEDLNSAHGRSNSVFLKEDTLTTDDQNLLQTAINYYVTGNM